jgi:hypothetical protein
LENQEKAPVFMDKPEGKGLMEAVLWLEVEAVVLSEMVLVGRSVVADWSAADQSGQDLPEVLMVCPADS